MKEVDLVLISVNSPVICGIYMELKLAHKFESFEKTSDGLIEIFSKIFEYLKNNDLKLTNIFYAKGPGSFSALKLTHIFLHTLKLEKSFNLFSTDSFYFNKNSPIKAFGNKYFIKNNNSIELIGGKDLEKNSFNLPLEIFKQDFDSDNNPLYILPPI